MHLIAVTTCTDRKRFPNSPQLDAASLPVGRQSVIAREWRNRVCKAATVGPAHRVYCGRSFREAESAARYAQGSLRIISAGLGLVQADQLIPSYRLSLVRHSEDFIGRRITGEYFEPTHWWSQVQATHSQFPLADLLHDHLDAILVIAISKSYLPLIIADLLSGGESVIERVRLIGMNITSALPAPLVTSLLPYDNRFDGPDSPMPGTRGDFAARAMRHFVEAIFVDNRRGTIAAHKKSVQKQLARLRRPKKIVRIPKSDDEIVEIIRRTWRLTKGQSARALRHLRDVENIACEQSRFRELFGRAKQVMP